MTHKRTRLLKLQARAKLIYPPKLIVVTFDHDDQACTCDGKRYTAAEWEAWKAAHTTDDDTILEVHYDSRSPDEIRAERERDLDKEYRKIFDNKP